MSISSQGDTPPTLGTAPATATTNITTSREDGARHISPQSLPTEFAVTNLDFDVTENCNLGCLYCFKGEMYTQNMTLQTMHRAFEWLLEASGTALSINCNFMGGEPTMRFKQIKRFVPWAVRRARTRGKRATFSMTTNLTLFTDEIRSFVDQYGFGVLMSIDGCPEVQDTQRPSKNGKAMSATVEYWAKSMLRTRPNCTARMTIHPDYINRFYESVQYLTSIGFREVCVSPSEYADWTDEHFALLDIEWSKIENHIERAYRQGAPVNITSFKFVINKLIHKRATGLGGTLTVNKQPCGAGRGYMMVDYTGDIWPCHRFDGADQAAGAGGQFRMGNIYTGGFRSDLQRTFVDFDHSAHHKDMCVTCPVNPVCSGYCPAANLSDTGSIYTPHDTYCRWSQSLYASAERLYERFKVAGETMLEALLASAEGVESAGDK